MDEGAIAEIAGDYPRRRLYTGPPLEAAERFDRLDQRRAVSWNALATMYDALGRFAEAEAAYRRALKAAAESTGKSGAEYALVLGNFGSVYVETGHIATGEKLLRQSLAIYPRLTRRTFALATARNALGEVLSSVPQV